MLILQRRPGESLRIGDNIEVSVISIDGGRVRLAITAPTDITVLRSELVQARAANQESVMEDSSLLDLLGESLPQREPGFPTPLKPAIQPHEAHAQKD